MQDPNHEYLCQNQGNLEILWLINNEFWQKYCQNYWCPEFSSESSVQSSLLALPPLEQQKDSVSPGNLNAPQYKHSTLSVPTSVEPWKLSG